MAALSEKRIWPTAAIGERIHQQMKRLGGSGAAVAVVSGDEVIIIEGFGQTARNGGEPVTARTLFQVGSVTKGMTALAILQLRDRGLLDLDDPVQRHLPWFRMADPAQSAQITVRQLLNQTSGISMAAWRVGLDNPAVQASEESAARAISHLPLQNPPGASWMYSNMNYMILGALVTAVSGQPYRTYVQENLFRPLGMHQATFDGRKATRQPYARGYQGRLGRTVEIPLDQTPAWGDAAGMGLFCSADDLRAYLTGLLSSSMVSRASLAEAQTCEVPTMLKGQRYGLGWWEADFQGERILFVPGQAFGSNAVVCLLPDRNLGVAVAANLYGNSASVIASEILAVLLGKERAPAIVPNMVRMMDPFFYGLVGVGIAGLVGLGLYVGQPVSPAVTVGVGVLTGLLLWAPGRMRRSPTMPMPLPANVGPGGWPLELVAAWGSLVACGVAWAVYGVIGHLVG